jgi:amino acid adenylation domain-containing protein
MSQETSPHRALSCLVLGEEPLAQRCAEVLLERGHNIVALVTNNQALEVWSRDQGILTLKRSEYAARIAEFQFDALLSITHPALISPSIISRAKVAAVNYHDGPLPRYAGMNGSAWALHNGEKTHAIVWHKLTAGLDEGDILERRDTTLEPRETSLSLNMKNSALALESFQQVVLRLETDDLDGTPQRKDVERSVFSRHDRPSALTVLDWIQSAEHIDHVIRACAFGQFPNRFGAAKVVHRERALIVREADLYHETDTDGANKASASIRPGTVLRIDEERIVIACHPGAISLKAFASLTGVSLTPRQAVAELRLSLGEVLAEPGREEWVAATRTVAEREPEFIRRLSQREIPQLPFAQGGGYPAAVSLSLPAEFLPAFGQDTTASTSALFLFTLSCLLREDKFTVALTDATHQRGVLATVCSAALPCNVAVPADATFRDFVEVLSKEQRATLESPGFLLDLIARDPSLREQGDLQARAISNVALVIGQAGLPPGAKLGLVISETGCALLTDGSFSPKELSSLAVRMATVAERLATTGSNTPLNQIDCLSAEERSQQLYDWNATARPFPDALRIFDLFEQQVDRQPNAVALVFRGQTMTFLEVERRANQIANALRSLGVGKGEYVGIIVERSFELVIALLGISKSGAAYVPVDTIYPADRTEFILEDTRCRVVVVSPEFVDRAGGRKAIVTGSPELSAASTERQPCNAQAEDVCYTIFTSGSTGKPKGVVLAHKAVVNTLDWVNRTFKVTPQDRLLFVTSPSFDLSVYDVFGALGAGASVEIASRELLAEPEKLVEHVCFGGITIWDSAPPALARLAPFFPAEVPEPKLRLVMLSGDWIPVTLPDHLMRVFAGVKVKSLGGATEAAIWSNFHHVDYVDPTWTSIPYGRPIQNARYYILDHHRRPIPAGLTGDLYIGGACLAQGYLNREELTADRFLPDPYVPSERIYKTGDLARFWSDGTMEFQGRADFQVKIRGFRVEIGEVEAALCAQPGVRTALCSAHQDASGQKALVAYVQPRANHNLDEDELKRALSVNLPDFMVPTFILFLDTFPLSSNGKIDRKALPTPDQKKARTPYAPPTTPLQRELVQIWQTVMKRDQIGIDDNFFELGGHSLMAVSLVTTIRSQLGLELTLSKVLERPTVRTLAAAFDNKPSSGAHAIEQEDVTVVTLRAGGTKNFFFIYDGEGETLLYLNLAKRLPENFQVYGVMPRTKPGIPLAHFSIEEMASFAIKQMKTFQPQGPYYIGGLCAGGVVSFEMTVQLERIGEVVNSVVLLEAFEPHASPRRGLTTQRRIDRFKRVFSNGEPTSFSSLLKARSAMLKMAATKVVNAAAYEVSSRIGEATIAAKLRLLERTLANDIEWPMWVTPLNTRDIYIAARSKYGASPVACKNVVLVKATEVVPGVRDDEPAKDSYVEPLLGWEAFVPQGIRVLDVSGGHTSMLQEPYVEDLSTKLRPLLG